MIQVQPSNTGLCGESSTCFITLGLAQSQPHRISVLSSVLPFSRRNATDYGVSA